jgi:hypothetical protein
MSGTTDLTAATCLLRVSGNMLKNYSPVLLLVQYKPGNAGEKRQARLPSPLVLPPLS